MSNNEVCGTCRSNTFDEFDDREFTCGNTKSEYCGDYVSYNHTCDFWEEKE